MSMEHQAKVCILGAGVTGLSSALILARNQQDVVVIEKDDVVGGLSRTIERDGFRFDIGGHRFFTKRQDINTVFEQVLGDEVMWVDRMSHIHCGGRYFLYPLQWFDTLKSVGLASAAHFLASYGVSHMRDLISPRPLVSVEDYFVKEFGHALYNFFFKSYTEKVWGIPCDQISYHWAGQRIRSMSLAQVLKKAFFPRSSAKPVCLTDRFMYPEQGIGRLCERMADTVGRQRIWLNHSVVGIKVNSDGTSDIDVACTNQHQRTRIRAKYVISTIPLPRMLLLLDPPPPPEMLAAAARLRSRSIITVNFIVNRSRITDDTWVYIQDEGLLMSRIHEPKNWSRYMVCDDKTSLVAEYPCFEGDYLWCMSEADLIKLATVELCEKLGFLSPAEIERGFVIRVTDAYPGYPLDFQDIVRTINAYLASVPNLQIAGRAGMHRYFNMDHCIEAGIKAACNTMGSRYDLEQINAVTDEYLEGSQITAEPVDWLQPVVRPA